MANTVYDPEADEKHAPGSGSGISDDDLRQMTDINPEQEGAMDREASSGAARDIGRREGLFNPGGDSTRSSGSAPGGAATRSGSASGGDASEESGSGDSKAVGAGALSAAEGLSSAAGLFNAAANPVSFGGRLKNVFWGSTRRKRGTVGGGITGGLLTLILVFIGFVSGPAELVQLEHTLEKGFSKSDSDSNSRTSKLFRYGRALKNKDIGETRVGYVGSKIFARTTAQLADIGVTIERGPTGAPVKYTFDDETFSEAKGLQGLSSEEKISYIAEQLGVDPASISPPKGGKFELPASDYDLRTARLVAKNTVGLLEGGKIETGIKVREFTKFLNLPSLFHPFKRLLASQENKRLNGTPAEKESEQTQEEQAQAQQEQSVTTPSTPEVVEGDLAATDAADQVAASGGIKGGVVKALTLTATACLARGLAKDIPKIDRVKVVLPAVTEASNFIAIGSQVESGQDVSEGEIGAAVTSLKGTDGSDIWQAKSLQALAGGNTKGLTDITSDQQQAFDSHKTAAAVSKYSSDAIGGGTTASVLCSGPVVALQVIVGLAATVVGEVGTDGAITPAIAGTLAAKTTASFVGSLVFFHYLTHYILDSTTAKDLAKNAFKGLSGGNLLAYGARAAGNMASIASGGIDLGVKATNALSIQDAAQSRKQFESESFFARMFDINDSRSLLGHMADGVNPSFFQNIATMAGGFMHVGSTIMQGFASLVPATSAANDQTYDWGFTQFGIPDYLLNDPDLADPYANAGDVAQLLDSQCLDGTTVKSCGIRDRVMTCFGNDITYDTSSGSNLWNVVPVKDVDQNSDDYINNGNCNPFNGKAPSATDTDNMNWARIIMFVNDTSDANAASCFEGGDDQACSDFGANGGGTGSSSTPQQSAPSPASSSLNTDAAVSEATKDNAGKTKVGFALYDSTGNKVANYNEGFENFGASITKAMLLVAYLNQVGNGTLSADAKSQLTNMIENSDNPSANWVYKHLNHPQSQVNTVASQAGMTGFKIDTSDPLYVLGQSKITADDFAKFFSKVDTMFPASQQAFALNLLSNLSAVDQNGLLKSALPGTVYSKEGWKPETGKAEGAPYIVNQAAQFKLNGTTYGVAVTVGGTANQSSGEQIVQNIVSALISGSSP